MKLKALAAAVFTLAASASSPPSFAHISGDVIKIGLVIDLSSLYADVTGQGVVEAVKLAIADAGNSINGKKIELLFADYQNKADVAAGKAREWVDLDGVDVLMAGTNSSAALAISKIANEKNKPLLVVSTGTARLTNEECNGYTIHYGYDTVALAKGTGSAVVKQGGKSWYFLTADYSFGASLEKDTSDIVKANGGMVIGSVKHPINASDFSSFLVQAQSSKAQILGLANAGGDTINAIKAANEFGITKTMKLAGLIMFVNDVHALGLSQTQGMYLTDNWYWDQNEESRAWSRRYFDKMKKMPNSIQASSYSAALHYLKSVKATGTDNAEKVLSNMKATPINDMLTKNGTIRVDGRMVSDLYLRQVKAPSESKYPWDYYKGGERIPGDQAFTSRAESKCALWK
ncbi:ABC transporter substrate-binding protein [Noviherbaspirillum suwonense]|uniref:Branched-chain amino acid transport system substrate-binding protein n=1 Tax=Noviherbaspirillum suwonense TaxID=1224511 RepID=A0ABY1QP43_9BURK|nr:ABC transporter substrate-binding protein [Noviherbaspirillum suwonense]SMP76447.1 branched-chain amino acid transport system substrate-binding protein [Noviherbaspirillum suwonense]